MTSRTSPLFFSAKNKEMLIEEIKSAIRYYLSGEYAYVEASYYPDNPSKDDMVVKILEDIEKRIEQYTEDEITRMLRNHNFVLNHQFKYGCTPHEDYCEYDLRWDTLMEMISKSSMMQHWTASTISESERAIFTQHVISLYAGSEHNDA